MSDVDGPVLNSETRESGVVVVTIKGDLDSLGAKAVESDFAEALAVRSTNAVIDMSGVMFMSSGALAMFLSRAQFMKRAGGEMILVGVIDEVQQIFASSGFDTIFQMVDTMDEAFSILEK